MTALAVPPLPDPVENGQHSPENRREMSRRFIVQARNEIEAGNRLQAGEKAWGAVAQQLKIVGQERGWRHTSHRQVESIGRQIWAEYPDLASQGLVDTMSDAYFVGHVNFYENQEDQERIEGLVSDVERELPALERLATEAAQNPRPFEIETGGQRGRLRQVSGDNTLQIGDKSAVGFSNRHSPGSGDDGQGGVPVIPPSPGPNPYYLPHRHSRESGNPETPRACTRENGRPSERIPLRTGMDSRFHGNDGKC